MRRGRRRRPRTTRSPDDRRPDGLRRQLAVFKVLDAPASTSDRKPAIAAERVWRRRLAGCEHAGASHLGEVRGDRGPAPTFGFSTGYRLDGERASSTSWFSPAPSTSSSSQACSVAGWSPRLAGATTPVVAFPSLTTASRSHGAEMDARRHARLRLRRSGLRGRTVVAVHLARRGRLTRARVRAAERRRDPGYAAHAPARKIFQGVRRIRDVLSTMQRSALSCGRYVRDSSSIWNPSTTGGSTTDRPQAQPSRFARHFPDPPARCRPTLAHEGVPGGAFAGTVDAAIARAVDRCRPDLDRAGPTRGRWSAPCPRMRRRGSIARPGERSPGRTDPELPDEIVREGPRRSRSPTRSRSSRRSRARLRSGRDVRSATAPTLGWAAHAHLGR